MKEQYKWVYIPSDFLTKAYQLFEIKDINTDIITINQTDYVMAYVKQ
tara:strand:+ start:6107 stop:6247 length:141 start_codon:yes stop_codon:yes gene_type:complete